MATDQGNPPSFGGSTLFSAVSNGTNQTTNIDAADNILFNTSDASRGSAALYSTATSIWALEAGRTYRLTGQAGALTFGGATGILVLQWFDITAGAFFGNQGMSLTIAATGQLNTTPQATAIISPTVATAVELRIVTETVLTAVSGTNNRATAFIQTL